VLPDNIRTSGFDRLGPEHGPAHGVHASRSTSLATASAAARLPEHVEAVHRQSLLELGPDGRVALAWEWALTGARPSPITLTVPAGHPPSRAEILAEARAEAEAGPAPPGVPADCCDQIGDARQILAWLAGATDEIPVDDDNRGRFIGARDDFARTDHDMREVRDWVLHGLSASDIPDGSDWAGADIRRRRSAEQMDAAWLRGVRDLLGWVLGERDSSPLGQCRTGLPTADDLAYEDSAAAEVAAQRRPGGRVLGLAPYAAPQYGEAIQARVRWLRGEATTPPADLRGRGPSMAPTDRS
jgi:hypothetical protein